MTLGDSGSDRVFGGLTSHTIGVVGWGCVMCFVVWCGVVWCDVLCCVVWRGVVMCGVVWRGVAG